MADNEQSGPGLSLRIDLGSELGSFVKPLGDGGDEFDRTMTNFMKQLIVDHDLQLPVKISTQIPDPTEGLRPREIRLFMNDYQIRLGPNADLVPEATPLSLAHWITSVIIGQSECLIDEDIADEIAKAWAADGASWFWNGMTDDAFRLLLQSLIKRGFRITRAKDWAPRVEPSFVESDPEHVFEEIVGPIGTCSLAVLFSPALFPEASLRMTLEVAPGSEDGNLKNLFGMMRDGLFYEMGVLLPMARIHSEEDIIFEGEAYRFRVNDRRLPPLMPLAADQVMVNTTADHLHSLGFVAEPAINPANGNTVALTPNTEATLKEFKERGLWVWDRFGHMILALAAETRRHLGDFHTRGIAGAQLNVLSQAFPGLVSAARDRFGDEKLTKVFRELVDGDISIRDYRSILEALLGIRRTLVVDPNSSEVIEALDACLVTSPGEVKELTVDELVSHCRRVLRRYVSYKYGKNEKIAAYTLHRDIEARLRDAARQPITNKEYCDIISAIMRVLEKYPAQEINPVILAAFDVRPVMRNTIRPYYPHFAVLSRIELLPEIQIEVLGEIAPA